MLSIPSTSELAAVRAAYSYMTRCNEAVSSSNSLSKYPSNPINLNNTRLSKSQKKNTRYENKTIVQSLSMPSDFFKGLGNAPETVILELANDGIGIIHWQNPTSINSPAEAKLDAFLKSLPDDELDKYVNAISDMDSFAITADKSTDEREIEFYCEFEDMPKDQLENVLKHRHLGKFKNGDETRIAFCPTVIDIIRIFKFKGIEEIPTVLLKMANDVDDNPSKYIIDESASLGKFLAHLVLRSTHDGTSYTKAKSGRTEVIRNAMDRDVGDPVFVLLTDLNANREKGLTIITEKGVIVGFRKDLETVTTAYFATPNDVIRCVTCAIQSVHKEPWGTPHSRSSIPTSLMDECIYNIVNKRSFLDNGNSKRERIPNCRRYIEAKD